ncbi:MAG: flagellar biosynthesis anti-sigma factor FlgM [Deltaproteobacteria bacterium]
MERQIPPFREKRQFGRINICEPTLCQVYVPQSQKLWENQGKIRNISLGGIYFLCDAEPPLERDDIQYLTFDAVYRDQKIYRLMFHGLVVRTEAGVQLGSQVAVALKFLSDPVYYPLKEFNSKEFPFIDKTRLMYQHYHLNKMAHEIIRQTPEIRTARIDTLKKRVERDLYKIESAKLAQCFTDNLVKNIRKT